MQDSIAVGLAREVSHEVTPDMSPGHLDAPVLSTPAMIGLVEQTCLITMAPHLDEGETSVGTHVCVSHEAAVPAGERIVVAVRVAEVVKRRITFETTVRTTDGRTVSRGTHQRAVIDTRRFAAT